jgi:hypothetical protein
MPGNFIASGNVCLDIPQSVLFGSSSAYVRAVKYFDRSAFRAGLIAALIVAAMIFLGSRWLRHFDWALTTYAVGTIFAAFAVAYRYAVWAQRPPTDVRESRLALVLFAGCEAPKAGTLLLNNFVLQTFITKRSSQGGSCMPACPGEACLHLR